MLGRPEGERPARADACRRRGGAGRGANRLQAPHLGLAGDCTAGCRWRCRRCRCCGCWSRAGRGQEAVQSVPDRGRRARGAALEGDRGRLSHLPSRKPPAGTRLQGGKKGGRRRALLLGSPMWNPTGGCQEHDVQAKPPPAGRRKPAEHGMQDGAEEHDVQEETPPAGRRAPAEHGLQNEAGEYDEQAEPPPAGRRTPAGHWLQGEADEHEGQAEPSPAGRKRSRLRRAARSPVEHALQDEAAEHVVQDEAEEHDVQAGPPTAGRRTPAQHGLREWSRRRRARRTPAEHDLQDEAGSPGCGRSRSRRAGRANAGRARSATKPKSRMCRRSRRLRADERGPSTGSRTKTSAR